MSTGGRPPESPGSRVAAGCGWGALVAVAMLLLFPVGGNSRDASRRLKCAGQLKQLSRALQAYAADYDETLPPAASWRAGLGAHLAQDLVPELFRCPSDLAAARSSYGLNEECGGRRTTDIVDPAAAPLAFDSWLEQINGHDRLESFARRHRQGRSRLGVVGFADGHVKSLKHPPPAGAGLLPRSKP